MKLLTLSRTGLLALLALASTTAAHALSPKAALFLHRYYAAYNAAGVDKLASFYAPDATLTDPTFGLELKGSAQIKELLSQVLAKYDSIDWKVEHTTMADDDLVVEGAFTGKIGGHTARVPFVSVFHFEQGKIATQRDMFDVLHFYAQIGVTPPAFKAANP